MRPRVLNPGAFLFCVGNPNGNDDTLIVHSQDKLQDRVESVNTAAKESFQMALVEILRIR